MTAAGIVLRDFAPTLRTGVLGIGPNFPGDARDPEGPAIELVCVELAAPDELICTARGPWTRVEMVIFKGGSAVFCGACGGTTCLIVVDAPVSESTELCADR